MATKTKKRGRMLTKKEIKALILIQFERYKSGPTSREAEELNTTIRVLTAVLRGKPIHDYADTKDVCDYAGIPCRIKADGFVTYQTDWLIEHGFVIDEKNDDLDYHDPKFGIW